MNIFTRCDFRSGDENPENTPPPDLAFYREKRDSSQLTPPFEPPKKHLPTQRVFALLSQRMLEDRGPEWPTCRKALVTGAVSDFFQTGGIAAGMAYLPKGIGD